MAIDIDADTAAITFNEFAESIEWAGNSVFGIPEARMVQVGAGFDAVYDQRMTVEVLRADVGAIVKGTLVVIRGKQYKVDTTAPDDDPLSVVAKVLLR
jgi:hypothetical protein